MPLSAFIRSGGPRRAELQRARARGSRPPSGTRTRARPTPRTERGASPCPRSRPSGPRSQSRPSAARGRRRCRGRTGRAPASRRRRPSTGRSRAPARASRRPRPLEQAQPFGVERAADADERRRLAGRKPVAVELGGREASEVLRSGGAWSCRRAVSCRGEAPLDRARLAGGDQLAADRAQEGMRDGRRADRTQALEVADRPGEELVVAERSRNSVWSSSTPSTKRSRSRPPRSRRGERACRRAAGRPLSVRRCPARR